MDPAFITQPDWPRIFDLVHLFWALPLCVIGFAFSLLAVKAIIPSLVSTHHLSPERAHRLRPFFYGVSVISLGFLVWVVFNIVNLAGIIHEIYGKWWI